MQTKRAHAEACETHPCRWSRGWPPRQSCSRLPGAPRPAATHAQQARSAAWVSGHTFTLVITGKLFCLLAGSGAAIYRAQTRANPEQPTQQPTQACPVPGPGLRHPNTSQHQHAPRARACTCRPPPAAPGASQCPSTPPASSSTPAHRGARSEARSAATQVQASLLLQRSAASVRHWRRWHWRVRRGALA